VWDRCDPSAGDGVARTLGSVPAPTTSIALLLLAGAVWVGGVNVLQVLRGRQLRVPRSGHVRDVRDVRRRSTAAVAEATGVAVLALGLLARVRPLVALGAALVAVGALAMSVARRGVARRRLR
jgi:hypothetical protein